MVSSPTVLAAIREIFFLSSARQLFESEREREEFFALWTEYYFKFFPDLILVDQKDEAVRGYLMGCPDSEAAMPFYASRLKSYSLFADQFARFPAHLHMNVHPSARNEGVGGRLLARFAESITAQGIAGAHLVTSPDSPNRAFYRRHGFNFELERHHAGYPLLFMGRSHTGLTDSN